MSEIFGTETEYGMVATNNTNNAKNNFINILMDIRSILVIFVTMGCRPPLKYNWDLDSENPENDARGISHLKIRIELEDNLRLTQTSSRMLENGARFYLDHMHLEYSTPECAKIKELVATEKAGEKILEKILKVIRQDYFPDREIKIFKNNCDNDTVGHSWGAHENYLLSRNLYEKLFSFSLYDRYSPELEKILIPFLVSRQIIVGAGKVGSQNMQKTVSFQISQRADFFTDLIGIHTMRDRPIINTRDEPHADRQKYSRLHLILGDSNMSEYAMYLKVGLTSMILEIMEDQYEPLWNINLSLLDPVEALHEISQDPSCTIKVLLRNGDALNAVEILEKYAQIMEKYYFHDKQERLTDEKKDIYEKFVYVIACLKKNPALLYGKLDWITKKIVIEQSLKKYGSTWENYRDKMVVINGEETPLSDHVQTIDLQYHNIDESNSIYYLLERKGHMERIVSDEEIKLAMTEPPEGTRAYFRGKCMKNFHESITQINWDIIHLQAKNGKIFIITLNDPHKGTKNLTENIVNYCDVETLIKNLQS